MKTEIIVRYSKIPIAVKLAISLILGGSGFYAIYKSEFLQSLVAFVLLFVLWLLDKQENKIFPAKKVVMKISETRLWTRNGNKEWGSIIVIKFRSHGNSQIFMDIYRSNEIVADEEIDITNLNYSSWRLKRILKKYASVENH